MIFGRRNPLIWGALAVLAILAGAACGSTGDSGAEDQRGPDPEGPGGPIPDGPLAPSTVKSLDVIFDNLRFGFETEPLETLVADGDPRVAWLLADLLRFAQGGQSGPAISEAIEELAAIEVDQLRPWASATDQLMSLDLPAPPGYLDYKRQLFALNDPRWEPLFSAEANVEWRHVSWGGVFIDDRPFGSTEPCPAPGCIPALDEPVVTDAAGGSWYRDDGIVFGIVVNGEARAYPRHMMEVHEMVNDTLGGVRIGVPYCTLCGSAQAYRLDNVVDREGTPLNLVLRTSGLLMRSNKMMFDLETTSLIDTFTGVATSGPLLGEGVELDQYSVVTSTWGAWKADYPDTTILASDGGVGRTYSLDPLRGRDDNGPIFPIGDVDPRLPVQEPVLGLERADGTALAIVVADARQELFDTGQLNVDGIEILLAGDGIRAVLPDGSDAGAHQAFWFAWSQFRPGTEVWPN